MKKNTDFPAILVFLKLSWLKGSLFFMFKVFVLICLFLVLSVCNLSIVWCLCCLLSLFANKTKWFSGLHRVVLFLSWLFCVFLVFSFLSRKDPKQRTQRKPQNQKCRKKGQTNKSVSAIVFTNSVPNFGGGGLQKCYFSLKTL